MSPQRFKHNYLSGVLKKVKWTDLDAQHLSWQNVRYVVFKYMWGMFNMA